MELQKELLPNFKTANESKVEKVKEDWTSNVNSAYESVNENVHTAPSYSFAVYCEQVEKQKSKRYLKEEFDLDECRYDIFGEDNKCPDCEGTGWLPVSKANMKEPLRTLWVQAEVDTPAEDGYHLVPCPCCQPMSESVLDEHIVKKGGQFELKSKKSGKNLGTYKSKAGAVKRERQVEYFKHLKEDQSLPGHPKDTVDSGYDKGKKPTEKDVEKVFGEEGEKSVHTQWEGPKPLPWRLHEEEKVNKTEQEHQDAKKKAENANDASASKREHEKEKREAKEKERKSKKLLPYEFVSQKDAERSAKHLGVNGSHTTGSGVYKPGSSEYSLRDAVARKKQKQRARGGLPEEVDNVNDAYPLDKQNLPETIQRIKDVAKR